MTKAELRKIYLGRQRDLGEDERLEKSQRIADRFFANLDLSAIKILHCFIPIQKFNEIDTIPIFKRLWNEFPHITTVVPRVDLATAMMECVTISEGIDLKPNEWGIDEPVEGEILDERSVDLVVVPGLTFDRQFNRVGYGKGFYDRFLARCRADCRKIGLSYFPPVESIDDTGAHDVRLDHCVTPDEIYSHSPL